MIWWPTTQHGLVEEEQVQTIDSRSGEHFNALSSDPQGNACIEQRYDGCASWWTQVIHPFPMLRTVLKEDLQEQPQDAVNSRRRTGQRLNWSRLRRLVDINE